MKNESFLYRAPNKPSPIVILCDHATNIVPDWVNGGVLDIASEDMNRHIAYDIGAMGVSERLAEAFDAHFIATQFSRLVIDPNRGEDDPTLIMRIYDRTIIPANRALNETQKEERLKRLYLPYHQQITKVLEELRADGHDPLIMSIHSFTKQLRGREPRPWHVGVLSSDDRRLSDRLIAAFEAEGEYCVGDNQPYHGALYGDTLDKHGIRTGFHHSLIEIRNDLIENEEDEASWANILHRVLSQIFAEEGVL